MEISIETLILLSFYGDSLAHQIARDMEADAIDGIPVDPAYWCGWAGGDIRWMSNRRDDDSAEYYYNDMEYSEEGGSDGDAFW